MSPHSSTKFQLAVFDVAGTTVLDDDAVVASLIDALDKWISVSRSDALAVMGLPKPQAIRQLLSLRGAFRGETLEVAVRQAHGDFRQAIVARYRDGPIVAADDAESVFGALRDAGVRVVLDTGFSRDILDIVLGRLGWLEGTTIDFSIASDEVERGRPHPDLIYRAMALTTVSDAAAVVKIGDTPADIAQGLAASCGCVVGVTYGTHTREQLDRPGVHTIDYLSDLLPLLGVEAHGR